MDTTRSGVASSCGNSVFDLWRTILFILTTVRWGTRNPYDHVPMGTPGGGGASSSISMRSAVRGVPAIVFSCFLTWNVVCYLPVNGYFSQISTTQDLLPSTSTAQAWQPSPNCPPCSPAARFVCSPHARKVFVQTHTRCYPDPPPPAQPPPLRLLSPSQGAMVKTPVCCGGCTVR